MTETVVRRTLDELAEELQRRFGTDPAAWSFVCPRCGDVASVADFRAVLAGQDRGDASDHIGQVCIGRLSGALTKPEPTNTRGCDWAAFGLFRGPEFVVMPDGREVPSFAIAPGRDS